jgi:hypothetical protein
MPRRFNCGQTADFQPAEIKIRVCPVTFAGSQTLPGKENLAGHPSSNLRGGLSGCKTFCIGSFQRLNGAIMQANKATDDREIGRNFDHLRMGANDLDNMSMGKICDKDQGAVCIPWRTLAERVTGFMETYERSFHA